MSKNTTSKYTVLVTEECHHKTCGFQIASRRHFSSIEEVDNYIKKIDAIWDEYNREHPERTPVKYCYRVKNNETKEHKDII